MLCYFAHLNWKCCEKHREGIVLIIVQCLVQENVIFFFSAVSINTFSNGTSLGL